MLSPTSWVLAVGRHAGDPTASPSGPAFPCEGRPCDAFKPDPVWIWGRFTGRPGALASALLDREAWGKTNATVPGCFPSKHIDTRWEKAEDLSFGMMCPSHGPPFGGACKLGAVVHRTRGITNSFKNDGWGEAQVRADLKLCDAFIPGD